MKTKHLDECDASKSFLPVLPVTAITRFQKQPLLQTSPLGLKSFLRLIPRVARASQPWAIGWNPVGIRSLPRSIFTK
jgi:hypothetical protein